ncbi:MAG: hypothetical protein EBY62_09650 [Cellvibrionales bacterium]|nr:hypothetical protein [Cellvibrionales bacterium]
MDFYARCAFWGEDGVKNCRYGNGAAISQAHSQGVFTMRYLISALCALCLAGSAIADTTDNNLSFAPRQDSAPMTVTSINLTKGGGIITATGEMGKYGRVYTTYTLTADPDGMQGTVLGWIGVRCLLQRRHQVHHAHLF